MNPLRWTALTWFALTLWLYGAIPLNYPPSVSYEMDEKGELINPTTYASLQDYPFAVGWPLHYVEPDDPALWTTPIPVAGPPIVPGPSHVSYAAAAINALLVVATLAGVVFLSQTYLPRFSILSLLLLPALLGVYIVCARLVARGIGIDAYWYYAVAVYFSPLLLALLHGIHASRLSMLDRASLRPTS